MAATLPETLLPAITSGQSFAVARRGRVNTLGWYVIHTSPRTAREGRGRFADAGRGALRGIALLERIVPPTAPTIGTVTRGAWSTDGFGYTIDEATWTGLDVKPNEHVWLFGACIPFSTPIPWPGATGLRWEIPVDARCPTCGLPVRRPIGVDVLTDEHEWAHLTPDTDQALRDARKMI